MNSLTPLIRPAQQPSPMPVWRYSSVEPIQLPDRMWPSRRITNAPRWLSTDLRDGNQALIDPMTPRRKRLLYDLIVQMGIKEIEVGFPSASQTEFDFVRSLIESDAIPDDVTISVLTQAREDLIERTVESVIGAPRVTIHLYNAVAELFRRVVFKASEEETINLAQRGTQWVIDAAQRQLGNTPVGYEYSPEIFSQTPTDFAIEVCNAVMDVWQPDSDREIILNLPATVERSTPNVYADQIEYFSRHINNREHVAISVHPHNDRGTAVAAAELAVLAGADRIEGCLFGHGERTGNVDLVTLGMNLVTQGVDPELDFSDIGEIRRVVEYCTGMPVPPRQPYSGDLVYTAFSGSHQDAIKKGLESLQEIADATGVPVSQVPWEAPYLPVDPHDVGRNYEAVIRVNSQSGKGGIAYLMKSDYKMDLPRRLQVEFSKIVQDFADSSSQEVSSAVLWEVFAQEYLDRTAPIGIKSRTSSANEGRYTIDANLIVRGEERRISGEGNGPVSAFIDGLSGLGGHVRVLDYAEHALSSGSDARAAAYVECELGDNDVLWGVGIDPDVTTASLKAIISAINRHLVH